jgi:hypothetical protein
MDTQPDGSARTPGYDVGIAWRDFPEEDLRAEDRTSPGYDEASGERAYWGRHTRDTRPVLRERGSAAVQVATEALAAEIAAAAQSLAASLEQQPIASPSPGRLGLESIDVSFGVTFTGGVQWLFTAQAESSAQVTLTLARRPPAAGGVTGQ